MSDGDGGLPIQGVDYAFPPRPSPAALAAAGFRFACRYGGPGTEDKWIHADEAQALSAAGVWIVANAEGSASGLLGGWNAGVSWAKSADAWFKSIGMPPDRPIYLSVDFDATADQMKGPLADALLGARHVLGPGRVGVYGGYRVMAWAAANGLADWLWQTYAWSGGQWFAGNHVEQYHNGVTIDGADCDLNRALQSDFGQWTTGAADMTPDESRRLSNVDSMLWYGLTNGKDIPEGELRLGGGAGTPTTAPTPVWTVERIKSLEKQLAELQAAVAELQGLDQAGVEAAAERGAAAGIDGATLRAAAGKA